MYCSSSTLTIYIWIHVSDYACCLHFKCLIMVEELVISFNGNIFATVFLICSEIGIWGLGWRLHVGLFRVRQGLSVLVSNGIKVHKSSVVELSFCVFDQDEFRRWFLAKVRVMLAPGSNPFHSLETQTTSPSSPSSPSCPFSPDSTSLANGHTPHPSDSSPAEELIRRFADYQPTQVG